MTRFLSLLPFALCLLPQSAYSQTPTNLYKAVDAKAMKHWVDSIFDSMTTDERIGQLFMLVADPKENARQGLLKNIKEQKIGGILFSKGELGDQATSINVYQKASRIPLFISFDGEWGLSMRLKETPLFPWNMMLGAVQDNELIRLYGEEVGRECNELGVQINFAPVLDVNVNPKNPVIGSRSFGENQQLVAEKAIAYSKGLESRNVIAVGKHFPGHGDTTEDSHVSLPKITHDRTRLDQVELYPFREYIRKGFSGMMTGHLSVPALDNSKLPTSLSPAIVSRLLQGELGFTGLAFTDALVMKGANNGNQSVCVQALLAGNDVLLSPGKPETEFAAVKKAVEDGVIDLKTIEEKCLKILRYKYITGLHKQKSIPLKGLKNRINSAYSDWLIQRLNEEAITLLKNKNDAVPLKQLGKNKIALLSIGVSKKSSFQKTLSLYGGFDSFQIEENATEAQAAQIFKKLKNYDGVICGIHSAKIADSAGLTSLCTQKKVHFCFFISPYKINLFEKSLASAESVTLAYENTEAAQKAAAQVIMGGLPAKGKLPVTIPSFDYGAGLATQKVRLSYQSPKEAGMSETGLNRIEEIVKEGISKQAFPGCQVLVAKNGIVVYNKSFGYFDYANTHPVQTTDVYDLASVTKIMATVPAIMKMYDTKKIGLEDRLSKYIPELKNTDKSDISIREALFHQTGLVSFLPFYTALIDTSTYKGPLYSTKRTMTYSIEYDKNTYVRSDFKFLPDKVSTTSKKGISKQVAEHFFVADDINQTVIQAIADSKLRKNKNYLYSDLNFILLKEVVENTSKQALNIFLEKEFYAGLGADHTLFLPLTKMDKEIIAPTENDEFLRNQILIGHVHDEAAAVLGGVSGNAGLFSNANDMAKIGQLFLNAGTYGGERYWGEATVKLFTQTQSPFSRRGLGFDKPDEKKMNPLVSSSTYGHTGYTGTCIWIDPDNKLVYIFLSNRVYPSRRHTQLMELNIRNRIQEIIYDSLR